MGLRLNRRSRSVRHLLLSQQLQAQLPVAQQPVNQQDINLLESTGIIRAHIIESAPLWLGKCIFEEMENLNSSFSASTLCMVK